jgi:hypothetical protein
MAELEQVRGRLVGAGGVRRRNRRDPLVDAHPRVDDDEAEAVLHQRAQLAARLLGQHEQRAVGGPVHQPLEQRDLAIVLVQRRAEDDPHVLLVERLGDAGDDHREVGRVDQRHGHADEPGAAGRQAARAAIRAVAVLADHALDVAARLGRDVAAAVDDARDRRRRDAGERGDLADRVPGIGACRVNFGEVICCIVQKRYMFQPPCASHGWKAAAARASCSGKPHASHAA